MDINHTMEHQMYKNMEMIMYTAQMSMQSANGSLKGYFIVTAVLSITTMIVTSMKLLIQILTLLSLQLL